MSKFNRISGRVCKPDSVRRVLRVPTKTSRCKQRTPGRSFLWVPDRSGTQAAYPRVASVRPCGLTETGRAGPPLLFGLAPRGVFRASSVATRAVGSYPTVSPLPNAFGRKRRARGFASSLPPGRAPHRRFIFCGTLRSRALADPTPWRYQARCPRIPSLAAEDRGVRTFLQLAKLRCSPRISDHPTRPLPTLYAPRGSVSNASGESVADPLLAVGFVFLRNKRHRAALWPPRASGHARRCLRDSMAARRGASQWREAGARVYPLRFTSGLVRSTIAATLRRHPAPAQTKIHCVFLLSAARQVPVLFTQ